MIPRLVAAGGLNMFLSVALGAFAAHGLKSQLSAEMLAVFHTGVQYQAIHGLGVLILASLASRGLPERAILWPAGLFILGICLFSGSLYAVAITGVRAFGAITPLGGLCFLLGWAIISYNAIRESKRRNAD